jgi:Predicted Zn-dependent proteases
MRVKSNLLWLVVPLIVFCVQATTRAQPFPPFLPDYFHPTLETPSPRFVLDQKIEEHDLAQFIYSREKIERLSILRYTGDPDACRKRFNGLLENVGQAISTNRGEFLEFDNDEFHARIRYRDGDENVSAFMIPGAVLIWDASVARGKRGSENLEFGAVRSLVNRWRFEMALKEGSASLERWRKHAHAYARELIQKGRKEEALAVIEQLVAKVPHDFDGHLLLMEHTSNRDVATNSARTIFRNAEDPKQIDRAATFLGEKAPSLNDIPLVSTNDTGLRVVLIPIAPCSLWLLQDAADGLERIIDVPVVIRRFETPWEWKVPDRVARQREIESFLVQHGHSGDFNSWKLKNYSDALSKVAAALDPLSRFVAPRLIESIRTEPGQYDAERYMDELIQRLKPHRTADTRTMYVAITEANIYAGDYDFLFSAGIPDPDTHVTLMSYHMMLGRVKSQGTGSRQRLIGRMAKELVPASLKQLGIPRSTDPGCPYSSANKLEQVDRKGTTLSDGVKQALDKLRTADSAAN